MFRGTCAGSGDVAALRLTESSRPGDASGYARYQKPISLVLPLCCRPAQPGLHTVQSKRSPVHKPYSNGRVYYNGSLDNFFMRVHDVGRRWLASM